MGGFMQSPVDGLLLLQHLVAAALRESIIQPYLKRRKYKGDVVLKMEVGPILVFQLRSRWPGYNDKITTSCWWRCLSFCTG